MPHQCVRCGKLYDDGAPEILAGCTCSSKLFYFIRKDKLEEVQNLTANLTKSEKKQIENDVFDIIGDKPENLDETVVLDLESIRALKPGLFELDLVSLFNKKNPVIFKTGDGKYLIDIAGTFERRRHMDDSDLPDDFDKDKKFDRKKIKKK